MLWHALRRWQLWPARVLFSRCRDVLSVRGRLFFIRRRRLELCSVRDRLLLIYRFSELRYLRCWLLLGCGRL